MTSVSWKMPQKDVEYHSFLHEQLKKNKIHCYDAENWLNKHYPDWHRNNLYTWQCLGLEYSNMVGTFSPRPLRGRRSDGRN